MTEQTRSMPGVVGYISILTILAAMIGPALL